MTMIYNIVLISINTKFKTINYLFGGTREAIYDNEL